MQPNWATTITGNIAQIHLNENNVSWYLEIKFNEILQLFGLWQLNKATQLIEIGKENSSYSTRYTILLFLIFKLSRLTQ
jgi:hypothetical protein